MLMFKDGVSWRGISPQSALIVMTVHGAFESVDSDCIVTSMADSTHGFGSLHYIGNAVDFRTKHLDEPKKNLVIARIKESLPSECDVILESLGKENEHLHVEWQPKVG